MINKINNTMRYEMIYDQIKDAIINNQLKPMSKLNLQELSEKFGVSKTPVATAVRSLERDGYVVILPQNGTFVRELSKEEIESLYDLRILIEQTIIGLIVNSVDEKRLKAFRNSFDKLLNSKKSYEKIVDEYFELELSFHDYLSSCCPAIISTITKNIVDLTKRTRKLSFTVRPDNEDSDIWLKNDIEKHITIIEAIMAKDIERAKKYTINDIENTKNRVMNISF